MMFRHNRRAHCRDAKKNEIEEDPAVIESRKREKEEALKDLYATYIHPVKTFSKTSTKAQTRTNGLTCILKQRELGLTNFNRYPDARYQIMKRLIPNSGQIVARNPRSTFCGQFSNDGKQFFSACQDNIIRLFDTTTSREFICQTQIEVDEVGWSILDTALSPDRKNLAYSTWSDSIYMVVLDEEQTQQKIIPLHLNPEALSFSIFSLQYSADGTEIIGGSNDNGVYVYDLVKHQRTLRVEAHQDDVNAVRFVDNSNSLIVSGSDDSFVSIWDRRALKESQPKPVGIFAGHIHGITFVHSRMDTRYLISNSKDQSIKLWDMRRFSDEATITRARRIASDVEEGWDYRYQYYGRCALNYEVPGDSSVRTYRGHSVNYTLIRCYFSPEFTTGQKYIITGSSDGCVQVYDVLTGSIQFSLRVSDNHGEGRERCVRDVSWHPYENYIITTSWNSRRAHVRWTHSFDQETNHGGSSLLEAKVKHDTDFLLTNAKRSTTTEYLSGLQFLSDDTSDDSDEDFSIAD